MTYSKKKSWPYLIQECVSAEPNTKKTNKESMHASNVSFDL